VHFLMKHLFDTKMYNSPTHKLYFLFFVGFLSYSQYCNANRPEIILYNSRLPSIPTYVAVSSVGSENQLCLPIEIKITRICVMAGVWIFYPQTNYMSSTGDLVMYIRNPADVDGTCRNLPGYLDKSVGSYRFAGDHVDAAIPAINLYVNTLYRETEMKTNQSLPAVPFAFNSIIITGNERWQFYMKENYDGFSECLDEDENVVPDFTARFGVSAGDVKSIRKGCDKFTAGKLNPTHVFNGYNRKTSV